MADLQFKGTQGGGNAAWETFKDMDANNRSNTYADIAVGNADIARERADRENTQFDQGQEVDRAIGSGLANQQTGRNASMVRTLAKTPGGGRAAMQVQQADQKDSDQWERTALTAAAAGDEPTYQHFKQKSGLVVPPEVDGDVKARAVYARGSLVAERLYRNDPQKAYRFVTEFMQDGNMTRALGATGAPADKPHWNVTQLEVEGKRVLGLVDTISGRVQVPRGPDGQPIGSGVGLGAGRSGQQSGKVALMQFYIDKLGMTPQEAAQVANAPVVSPEKSYQDTFKAVYNKAVSLYGPEEAQRMANEAATMSADQVRQSPLYRIGKTPAPGGAAPAGPGMDAPVQYDPAAAPPPPRPSMVPQGVPSAGLALPPELANEADGTVVEDDAGVQYEKRGNTLVPLGQ
jgi:hypothetical protein